MKKIDAPKQIDSCIGPIVGKNKGYMIYCSFALNNRPVSHFKIGSLSFPAFSGLNDKVNRISSMCSANSGPIPIGNYYIVDRESGGLLGWARDLYYGKNDWFALYADDGKIDDETWCGNVKRGKFRLHPNGDEGISLGCITIINKDDFYKIRAILRSGVAEKIKGTDIKAWGMVCVT